MERGALAPGAPANDSPATVHELANADATDGTPWHALVTAAPADWYSEPPPKRDWMLRDARHPKARGVFPLGKVGQLIAEGGAGKTLALCQLAVAVSTGTKWIGAFEATEGRVLLVLGEEDAAEARRRLHHAANVGQGPRPEPGAIEVLPLAGSICAMLERDERGNAAETAFLGWLRVYVQARGFRLVVVDPLSRFAGPDAEKDNAVATRFMQALESLAAPDRSILNAHHVNKLSRGQGGTVDGSSGRGSSAFVDGARWQCALSVERLKLDGVEEQAALGEVVTFAVTKSNYAPKPDEVLLRRDLEHGGALVALDEADLETVAAVRGVDAGKAQRQRARQATATGRETAEDEAVIQAVGERAGIPLRELVKRVQAISRCGPNRAEVAIARVRERLDVRPGPRSAQLHYLPGTDP
jgi:RecA-family ATPase